MTPKTCPIKATPSYHILLKVDTTYRTANQAYFGTGDTGLFDNLTSENFILSLL